MMTPDSETGVRAWKFPIEQNFFKFTLAKARWCLSTS